MFLYPEHKKEDSVIGTSHSPCQIRAEHANFENILLEGIVNSTQSKREFYKILKLSQTLGKQNGKLGIVVSSK